MNGGEEVSKPAQPGAKGQPARSRRPDDSILADITQHVAQLQSAEVWSSALLHKLVCSHLMLWQSTVLMLL